MDNKVVYLISPPRSLSTAFLRSIQARNDFHVINEPGTYAYFNTHSEVVKKRLFGDEIPQLDTYDKIEENVFQMSKYKNVFVKEISFSMEEYLKFHSNTNSNWIKQKNLHFIFLLRNPYDTALSIYKKLKPDGLKTLNKQLGYISSYHLYQYIVEHGSNEPIIIKSEDLYHDSIKLMKSLCKQLNISYTSNMTTWNHISNNMPLKDSKVSEYTQHWHSDAMQSNGFHIPNNHHQNSIQDRSDGDGLKNNVLFENIDDINIRKVYQDVYQEHLPFYQELLLQDRHILTFNSFDYEFYILWYIVMLMVTCFIIRK
mgnify:CR=1 FL=1